MLIKNKMFTKIVVVIFTILFVIILFSQIQLAEIIKILTKIEFKYILFGFILYVISYLFRTLRFYILLNRDVRFRDLFSVVCLYNIANNIMPARTGELSYIFLMKKHDTKVGVAIATLIVAKIFDIITISILLFISAISFKMPIIMEKAMWAIGLLILIVDFALVIMLFQSKVFLLILNKILIFLKLNDGRFVEYITRKLDEMVVAINQLDRSQFILIVPISIVIWLTLYYISYILVIGMGINMSFESVMFASTLTVLTTILPVQGIAGFGTFEGGWTVGFLAYGITKEIAISSGFVVHSISIIYFCFLGLIGLMIQPKK